MKTITKQMVIDRLVKSGCNILDATENVNNNFDYVQAHYDGISIARFAEISWCLD